MAKQIECRRGHDLTVPANRYTYPNGIKTQCMVCVRQSQARRKVGSVHARTNITQSTPTQQADPTSTD